MTRLPRRTVRLRLTVLYGGLFLASGAGLLAVTNALVAHRLPVTVTSRSHPGNGLGTMIYSVNGACGAVMLSPPSSAVQLGQQVGQCLNGQREAELNQLLAESGVALGIMTIASVALGWLVAGRVLRPLRTITAAARSISASSLHSRLALTGPDDEMKELGDTFDGLLARLEAAFVAQRQFAANASHELRTPLTRQCAVLEVALAAPEPSAAELRRACHQVLVAGRQQERLLDGLLTLATSQRGLDGLEPVDLAVVTARVAHANQAAADQRLVTIAVATAPAPAAGDARLLERLVANLVDNAIRYNVPGGRISVRTGSAHRRAVLAIANTGPVIAPAEVSRLFGPFQRLAGQRTAAEDGTGLGLSIVAAIAAAHGADLRALAQPEGGLDVRIRFPAAR